MLPRPSSGFPLGDELRGTAQGRFNVVSGAYRSFWIVWVIPAFFLTHNKCILIFFFFSYVSSTLSSLFYCDTSLGIFFLLQNVSSTVASRILAIFDRALSHTIGVASFELALVPKKCVLGYLVLRVIDWMIPWKLAQTLHGHVTSWRTEPDALVQYQLGKYKFKSPYK